MKGMKSPMNHPHRRERKGQSFARPDFLASIHAHREGRAEWKGLRKNWLGAFLAAFATFATVGVMAGCSSGAAKSSPQTQTPLISVAIVQAPPPSILTGNSVAVTAAVNNDPANAGVDWVVVCASARCGSVAPNHTASGGTAIYTAPPGVPSKNTVSVTALSTTDRSKSSMATVTIMSTVTWIAITTPLPGSVPQGAVVNLGATVYGDPANLGADWTVACPTPGGASNCVTGLHSDAGGTTRFTVPLTATDPVTGQSVPVVVGGSMIITAYATADHSFSAMFI